jgi:hypothetical protein
MVKSFKEEHPLGKGPITGALRLRLLCGCIGGSSRDAEGKKQEVSKS